MSWLHYTTTVSHIIICQLGAVSTAAADMTGITDDAASRQVAPCMILRHVHSVQQSTHIAVVLLLSVPCAFDHLCYVPPVGLAWPKSYRHRKSQPTFWIDGASVTLRRSDCAFTLSWSHNQKAIGTEDS